MILLFAIGVIINIKQKENQLNFKKQTEKTQKLFIRNEVEVELLFDSVLASYNRSHLNNKWFLDNKTRQPSGLSYFVFEGSQLFFWSDNHILLSISDVGNWQNHQLVYFKNGWYQVFKRATGTTTLVGLYLVKNQYAYQNKYIINRFNPTLKLPDNAEIIVNSKEKTYSINNSAEQYIFSIRFDNKAGENQAFPFAAIAFGLGMLCLFILLLDFVVLMGRIRSGWGLLIFVIVLLRLWMGASHFPSALYETPLFSPNYYASSYLLNSIGDLLTGSLLLSLIVIYAYLYCSGMVLFRIEKLPKKRWSVIILFLLTLTFLFSVLINYILSGLIINSQISFNINNVFELSTFSIIGIIIIAILLFSFYLICDGCVLFIQKTHISTGFVFILFLISQGIFLILLIFLRDTDFFINYGVSSFLLANFLMLFIHYVRSTSRRLFSFTRSLLVVFGFSLYAAQIIYAFNQTRERDKRLLLASKLENEQDLVAEYLFDNAAKRMEQDTFLIRFLTNGLQELQHNPGLEEETNSRLLRLYFSGYLGKYDVQLKYFNTDDIPINNIGDPGWNIDLLKQKINGNGISTNSSKLFLLENQYGRIRYLSLLPLFNDEGEGGYLSAELNARFKQGESGMPELLISDVLNRQTDITNYSYARYNYGTLVSQAGAYNYALTASSYAKYIEGNQPFHFETFNRYSHLFYKSSNGGLIILSIYNLGALVYITLFSYVFTFFSLLFLIIYLLIRGSNFGFKMFQNFKGRIQITIVSIVVASLILVGSTTIAYIIRNYTNAQNERIKEKLNSLIVLLENEIGERKNFGAEITDDLAFSFNQLAHTLGLDFNIYSPSGYLLFTSQPTIYEQDILAPLMNRNALTQLMSNQKAIYTQDEKIGSLSYIAAYEPLRNSNNQSIGYLNFPYFARESDLKKEISSFLVALINIYVLLFSFAIIATFFISNRITRPLKIIQLGLKRTTLSKSNEPLIWKRKDEIGSLVNQYNRMVEELQVSAEKIAKTERESAWREMAKQVAHEIKNPLTPMKLNVQHLQRAWVDKHPNLDQMFERISQTLIDQIESLSSIANAFSDFAKMPKVETVKLNLEHILQTTINLYNDAENHQIVYNGSEENHWIVLADKDHLLRIFANLIKNAIQSIPLNKKGIIEIKVVTERAHFIVSIKDNGTGISSDQTDKIFVPNFTTKTGGTGLGLALVKNMVESMDGSVWFDTNEGNGTTFFVKLLRYKETLES